MFKIKKHFQLATSLGFLSFIIYLICNLGSRETFAASHEALVPQIYYAEATLQACIAANAIIRLNDTAQSHAWTSLARVCQQAEEVARLAALNVPENIIDRQKLIILCTTTHHQISLNCKKTIAYLINSNIDGTLLAEARDAYHEFSTRFSPVTQAEEATSMFSWFVMYPADKETCSLMQKTLDRMDQVMTNEMTALLHLPTTKENATIIKGVPVPPRWVKIIEKLVADDKITSEADVKHWIRFLTAPLSSSMIDAMREIMEQFNESRFKKFEGLTEGNTRKFKALAVTEGECIGRIEYLPVKCPISDDQAKVLFEDWKNKQKRDLAEKNRQQAK